jgi:dephospho-CoA kinase
MLNVALTGNMGAGKTTVARLFKQWGATLIEADALVREVQSPGSPTLDAIVRRFGPAVLRPDGSLDRDVLRARATRDDRDLAALNAIVHPAVARLRSSLVNEAQARGDRIVVNDIPLLFEVMDPAAFDMVVLVDAPEHIRRARVMATRHVKPAEADRLMAAQIPSDQKRARSTIVIDNGGTLSELACNTRPDGLGHDEETRGRRA